MSALSSLIGSLATTDFYREKLYDVGFVLLGYALGLLFLYLGYRNGGRTWVRRHGLVWAHPKRKRLISGFWPELILFTACANLVLVVDFALGNVNLVDLLRKDIFTPLVLFILVFAIVATYSYRAVRKAHSDPQETHGDRKRLAGAYKVYCHYTTILFTGGALVIYLLIRQFIIDEAAFEHEAAIVRDLLTEAARLHVQHLASVASDPAVAVGIYAKSLTNTEAAFGAISFATNQLQDQMNPVFIFATAVFTINILIRFTAAKNAFLDGARSLTLASTAIVIGFAALFGFYTYFWSYSRLLDDAIAQLNGIGPDPRLGAWEMTRRFNELFVALNERKNLFGFAAAIGGQGSGLATFVFGIQYALGRIQDRDLEKATAVNITSYREWRKSRRARAAKA